MAGLRLIVSQDVDNEALCFVMTFRRCDDWASVVTQDRDLHALQDYIDALSGGPGKGWFRLVHDPFEARKIINEGKLAVVEGIEVSDVLGCGEMAHQACSQRAVDRRLDEIQKLGVSTFFPVHKFDNAVGGTRMDGPLTGTLIDIANRYMTGHYIANRYVTGHYWDIGPCPPDPTGMEHDTPQDYPSSLPSGVQTLIDTAFHTSGLPQPFGSARPCNRAPLTAIGAYLIGQMIRRHLIIEIDHMDLKTGKAALAIAAVHHYPGVISAHSWDTPDENKRIYALGGFVTPGTDGTPATFVQRWRQDRTAAGDPSWFGFGYGSDMNGLAEQPLPETSSGAPVTYPFRSFDAKVVFAREQWGYRTFDINESSVSNCDHQCGGVANYGMYADWLEAVRLAARSDGHHDGQAIMTDMFHGAEAYLDMWERASGVPAMRCLPAAETFTSVGIAGTILLGDIPRTLLLRTGQPWSRAGSAYHYCVTNAPGDTVTVAFGASGKVALVGGTAGGASAGGLRPLTPESRLTRLARKVASGLWLGPTLGGGARYVYGTTHGRVSFVGVASAAASRTTIQLQHELAGAGL
jgi:hypothetical protein